MIGEAWAGLQPDPNMVAALGHADAERSRTFIQGEVERIGHLAREADRRRERATLRDMRKRWSERFATACATMIADELRRHPWIRGRFSVRPDERGTGQETFTPLGEQRGKRIDVVVTGPLVGLQIGVSLKGLNFADDASGNHDKNLTGRLYELRDEVSTVHEHLPRAFMATVFFMPVAACFDKPRSSFAHVVLELRARTGRLDPSVAAHAWRCDFAAVCLYVPADTDPAHRLEVGIARYFPVLDRRGDPNWPPRYGLPSLRSTTDLAGLVGRIVGDATRGSAVDVHYAPAEGDTADVGTGDDEISEGGDGEQ